MTVSPMLNKFELRVRKLWFDDEPLWAVYVVVDGVVINQKNAIDLFDLSASCRRTGSYYILTCGCGDPYCGGIFKPVRVAVWKNRIRWKITSPESAREFHFDRIKMVKLIHKGISRIKREVESAGLHDVNRDPDNWNDYPVGPHGKNHATIEACLDILHEIIQQRET